MCAQALVEKLILIDGSGLIYRGFYAIPPFLKSPSGVLTNAVFGFTNILLSLLAVHKPQYMAVAFDKKGPTFRHKEYAAYKATRVKAPQELYDQIPLVREVVETFRIPALEADGYEADDILATIARRFSKQKLDILVATGDFDIFQIVRPGVSILYPARGFKEAVIFDEKAVREKYGLDPGQIPDFKGLAGDHSDNIPGVAGIGAVGATGLLQKYSSLENIYRHISEIPGALGKKLAQGEKEAFLSQKLATLDADVPLDFDLDACRVKHFDVDGASRLFADLGFKTLQKRIIELYGTKTGQGTLF